MQTKISKILAREILDSRGYPTVEVDLFLSDGSFGRASVPSGASTGSHEACELKDGDKKRYGGKGVLNAVKNVNTVIVNKIKIEQKRKVFDQKTLDDFLIKIDGTENKTNLGANAILGVSLAFAKAKAKSEDKPLWKYFKDISKVKSVSLPLPMMNIINGGKHADSVDFQEFMIVPVGAKSFTEAVRFGSEVFHKLKEILKSQNQNTSVGDEGGYAPSLASNESVVEIIIEAIKSAGYLPGKDIAIAMDVAASELYKEGKYYLEKEGKVLTADEMIKFYQDLIKKYPIISIEDGLSEDDWSGWQKLTNALGDKVQLVGDDFFVTNIKRLQKGIDEKCANSILIKLNQIGTVSETIDTVNLAKKSGYRCIISHRSGETEDTTISDFTVGLGAGQIKTGSLSRSERIAKYNQLIRIEESLGKKAIFNINK